MQNTEAVIVKVVKPNKHKAEWLKNMANMFSQAVQLGLDSAKELSSSSRGKIHEGSYYAMRELGLPSDYARMGVNAAISLARSFFKLRKKQKNTAFPKLNGNQGIGIGVASYKIVESNNRFVLRCSTGKRGKYIWLPLSVPEKFKDRMKAIKGDAKLFQKNDKWYVMLPVKTTPTGRSGDKTFIGVDLGIVRIATVFSPGTVSIFNGKEIRHRREHFADIRCRYQKHNRLDKVKTSKGHERRWMTDQNHKISKEIVEIASQYANPVICFEKLEGIRERARGSKRFNRMMASWAFRQLVVFVKYKAERIGVEVVFVDPRNTSRMCSKCGHISRSNRPDQANFRCVKCNHQLNADVNASRNIAEVGLNAYLQGAH
jgi:putative transposase